MRVFLTLSLLIMNLGLTAGVFYQTGYEASGEPFGDWKPQTGISPGQATTVKAFSGKSSRTPGFGGGRYGKIFAHKFKPELKAEKIWVSYRMYGEKAVSYLGFVMIEGNLSDAAGSSLAVYALISPKYILLVNPKTTLPCASLLAAWHQYEYELDFEKQTFNFYLDGQLRAKGIQFYAGAKGAGKLSGITQIKLGGSGAKDKAVFYDEFYVGTDRAGSSSTVKMEKVTGTIDSLPFLRAGKTASQPTLDGQLNDTCWQTAAAFSPFVNPAGTGKTLQTEAFVCYDNDNLYLAVRGYDEHLDPVLNKLDQIKKGTAGKDVPVWVSDSVEIFIAPEENAPNEYFHMGFNLADGSYDKHPAKGEKWDGNIRSATRLYDKYWQMEIAIPVKSLDLKHPVENSVWRFNLCRNKTSGKQFACWSPTFGSFHTYSRFGKLAFAANTTQIKLADSAIKAAEGSNQLNFKVISPSDSRLEFRNIIAYKDADTVANTENIKVKANTSTAVEDTFFIFTGNDTRLSSNSFNLTYEVRDANKQLLCRSAAYTTMLARYTPFKTSFICTSSNVIFKYFSSMFINRGGVRPLLVLIQADKKLLPEIDKVTLSIEMPEWLKLSDMNAADIVSCRPTDIQERITEKDGRKRRMTTMNISREWLYSMADMGMKQPYNKWFLVTFECAADAPLISSESVTYSVSAEIKKQLIAEKSRRLEVTIMPEISGGKVPRDYPVMLCSGPWIRILKNMSSEERDKFLAMGAKSGCNYMGYDDEMMSSDMLKQIRSHGFQVYYDIPINRTRSWRDWAFPGAVDFLKQHPEYRAVTLAGKTLDDVICTSVLNAKNSPYDAEMQHWIRERAKEADALMWDYEVPPARATSTCFCPRCMKEFAQFAGLSSVTPQQAADTYLTKWIDFQARQAAALGKKLYNCTKKANPDCEFWVYSGYQSPNTKKSYSVDWSYFQDALDRALCGYGRPVQAIDDTMAAIDPRKMVSGLLMQVWWNSVYNYNGFRNSLFRRITDGNGGILFWSDMQIDARFWSGVSDMTRLIAENKEFFLKHQRGDELCKITGISAKNLAVLRNAQKERLIFVFNPAGTTQSCTINNLQVPAGAVLKDFLTGKVYDNPQSATLSVPGFDVKILTLKK